MSDIYPERGLAPRLIKECALQGVLRNQCAYILATSQWETGHSHMPVKEAYYVSPAAQEAYLKSKEYYPYFGRGLVQLTWKYNYERADKELGLHGALVNDLDLALDEDIAIQIIIKGMLEGWFTTRPLSRYVDLQKSDFYNARRVVNGLDKAAEIAGLATKYDKVLLSQGYGVDTPDVPEPPEGDAETLEAVLKTIDSLEAHVAKVQKSVEDMDKRITALEVWRRS